MAAGDKDSGERNVMGGNTIKWLDVYRNGRGMEVKREETDKDTFPSMKASWGMAA